MVEFEVRSNIGRALRRIQSFRQHLPYAFDDGAKSVAYMIRDKSRENLDKLYWRSFPGLVLTGRGYLGRYDFNPDWTRIGALRAAESVEELFGEGYAVRTVSGEATSELLSIAGGGSVTKDPENYAGFIYNDPTNPAFQWRARGLSQARPQIKPTFLEAFEKARKEVEGGL